MIAMHLLHPLLHLVFRSTLYQMYPNVSKCSMSSMSSMCSVLKEVEKFTARRPQNFHYSKLRRRQDEMRNLKTDQKNKKKEMKKEIERT